MSESGGGGHNRRKGSCTAMKLLTCEFDDLVINLRRISELFKEKVLKETGREAGNWVSVDQAVWFLKEVVGMENAEVKGVQPSSLSQSGRLRSC